MKDTENIFEGFVEECLPNLEFKITLKDGRPIRAYTSGKMKLNKIRVVIGDKVDVVLPPGSAIGRVVRRHKL